MNGIQAAFSGLQAVSTVTAVAANNIANANTAGFKSDRVTLSTLRPQGVQASIEKTDSHGAALQEDPTQAILTDASNADYETEFPNLMLARTAYSANLKTVQTSEQMLDSLLDIKS